jgi:hypothetical protein
MWWQQRVPSFHWSQSPNESFGRLEALMRDLSGTRSSIVVPRIVHDEDRWIIKPISATNQSLLGLVMNGAYGLGVEYCLAGDSAVYGIPLDHVFVLLVRLIDVVDEKTNLPIRNAKIASNSAILPTSTFEFGDSYLYAMHVKLPFLHCNKMWFVNAEDLKGVELQITAPGYASTSISVCPIGSENLEARVRVVLSKSLEP